MPSSRLLAALAGMLLATAVAVAGCSGDADDKPDGDRAGSTAPDVGTNARLGKVRGKLGDARSDRVLRAVTSVVEQWSDAAYGGAGSVHPKGAFVAFTGDARALAVKQSALSNAEAGEVGDAMITERVIRVDVLAARGKAAGATARIRISVDLPGLDRTDQIKGRLLLTPAKGGWKVFGFDVQRGEGGSR